MMGSGVAPGFIGCCACGSDRTGGNSTGAWTSRGRKGGDQAPSGPSVKLILKGDPAAFQPGGTSIRIEGRAGGDSPLVRTARFSTGLPLAGSHYAAWLTVRQP